MLVTASQQAGVLEEDEEQMLHRVFHFAEFTAAEMMVPRTEMTAVKADATMSEVVDRVWRGRHTSLPVYRGELDDIVGIMLVPDLVRALASPPVNFSVAAIAREALTVPETMKADELLRQMRRHRTHQAIVIDEYGGTAGLVTFERVMERIVGELGGDFGTGASDADSPASGWICRGRRPCARDRHQRTVRPGHRRGNLHDTRRVHAGQARAPPASRRHDRGRRKSAARRSGRRPAGIPGADNLTDDESSCSALLCALVCAQQPHPVCDHEQRCAHVGDDSHPQRGRADNRERQKDRFERERERDVHANVAQRGAAKANRERDLEQLVGHQCDVSGLERRVGPGGTHRDAHVGRRKRGRVVDAVTHHRHRSVFLLQGLNNRDFVVGQQLGVRLVDADVARQRFGARVVVAGQHHDALHTLASEHVDGVGGRFPRAIGESDDAKGAALPRHEHRGAARRRQRVKLRVNGGVAKPALLDQPVVADERRTSRQRRPRRRGRVSIERRSRPAVQFQTRQLSRE